MNAKNRPESVKFNLSRPQSKIFNCGARVTVVVAGRRFGKTTLSIARMLRAVKEKRGNYAYIYPTYRQAKRVIWEPLKAAFEPLRPKFNEQALSIRTRGGSFIELLGANNPDSLRGPGLDGVAFDEYAQIPAQTWTEIIRPQLATTNGWALFIGTPKGRNHFHDLYQDVPELPDHARFQYTSVDGGWIPEDEIKAIMASTDERTFRQEYLGTFENYAGLVYYLFNRDLDVDDSIVYDPRAKLCWCIDFNIDPNVSTIAQIKEEAPLTPYPFEERRRRVEVIDEISLSPGDTRTVCEQFARRARQWYTGHRPLVVHVYGDASGTSRQTTSGTSNWAVIENYFRGKLEFDLRFHIPESNPAVVARVNAVNSLTCSYSGERRMKVHPRCTRLIDDFTHVCWEMDEAERTTGQIDKGNDRESKMRTHASDGFGYMVAIEFGESGYEQQSASEESPI